MEFVQFHPTGMIWPPSVRGILVTEGVRGEGGVLRNKEGKRFMFGDIPDNYKPQTAENEEEGFLYVLGEKYQGKDSRRPAELLTRDHVARCIVREAREGRGSPHGGVFLELQTFAEWYGKRKPGFKAEEHWKKKLPSMYHQFKELGGLDITKEPMEVGPTTHYMMGGVRVDSDTQMSRVPGLFACGECAAGINGANRLGGNSLSDLLVLGKRAGEYAAKYAKDHPTPQVHDDAIEAAARWALEPFDRPAGENPFHVMHDLQDMMQELVGIVRQEDEMLKALDGLAKLKIRAAKCHVSGNREYNPGWHTAIDLHNLLEVSEGITRAALVRKESRGAQFRDDYPTKNSKRFGKVNTITWRDSDGTMRVRLEPVPPMPQDLKDAIAAEGGGKLPEELIG
jgi:succinate dehydrogenase / fumarate reductase flavoprotein subunit